MALTVVTTKIGKAMLLSKPARTTASIIVLTLALAISGCKDDTEQVSVPTKSLSALSTLAIGAQRGGPTPFIAFVDLSGANAATISAVSYTIQPKPGTASQPVMVNYTISALMNRGRLSGSTLTIPVFGLYSGYDNSASIVVSFTDGSTQNLSTNITTQSYTDPNVYSNPSFSLSRPVGSALGFDYFVMKPNGFTPITILDSDGIIRWVAPKNDGPAVIFKDNGFYAGADNSPVLERYELDGSSTEVTLPNTSITSFQHDISPGPNGLLVEPNIAGRIEDVLEEMSPDGTVLKTWDLVSILSQYMSNLGDDPSQFVRPGIDWFHLNSAIYDPSDQSVILSSRENFVIKLDYATGAVKWIFGDPTKYWYQFPSLRAKSLSLPPAGLAPIGQHALSLTANGDLMMFNDGFASLNVPTGAPTGISRDYSAVTTFSIDAALLTATPTSTFDDNKSIYSRLCSSAYLSGDQSMLINYSQADNGTTLRMKGFNSSNTLVFDFSFPTSYGCTNGWNSTIIPFGGLSFAS